jgi:hypothetical protein
MAHAPGGCDFCGKSIPPSDFQSGRAVVLLKKTFCHDCMDRAVKSSKTPKRKGSSRHRSLTPKTLQVNLPRVHPTLRLGEHACSLYRTEEERRSQVAAFLSDGIRSGEKIFYAVDDSSSERVLEYLKGAGIDAAALLKSGQLEVYPTSNVYAPSGSFDVNQMLTRVKMIVDRVLKEGYPGVRATGEATWALRGWPGSEKLAEYELRLNALFPSLRCAALCQYDMTRFRPGLLHNLKATHPVVLAPSLS